MSNFGDFGEEDFKQIAKAVIMLIILFFLLGLLLGYHL